MLRYLPLVLLMLSACSSLQPRPAISSYGCMRVVRSQLPAHLPDKRLHCLAAAGIARQCSVAEAYLAGLGKELGDLWGTGDPAWADWQADRAGVQCGRSVSSDADIPVCCAQRGY